MMISTKGRYALRVMIDMAQHAEEGYLSLGDVAKREDISMKYLEAIVASLCRSELLQSKRGKAGGYRLCRELQEYSIRDILCAAEGEITPVECQECQGTGCSRSEDCLAVSLWRNLDKMIDSYLRKVTLADLVNGTIPEVSQDLFG